MIHLAALRLNAITNPLLPNYREKELAYFLNFANTKVVFIAYKYRQYKYEQCYENIISSLPSLKAIYVIGQSNETGTFQNFSDLLQIEPSRQVPSTVFGPDDISTVIFTSGTESKSKAVMHSQNTMMYGTQTMANLLNLTEDDVVWAPSPLGHGTGFLWGMRQALHIGAKLVLQETWDPEEALRLIEEERVTFTMGATPFAAMLVEAPSAGIRDTRSFRIFASAGAPIPQELGLKAREKLGCQLIGMWGMTECFVGTASSPSDTEEKLWGTDGRAMPGAEIAIFSEDRKTLKPAGEIGELATRGPHVALGYYKDAEKTDQTFSAEGWLFTNDLASIDPDGYVRISGRIKDIVNRGGLRISTREIEDMLFRHPNVLQVAIIALPDPLLVERSCAFIISRSKPAPTLDDLNRFLEIQGVAKYKLPEFMAIVDSFPMTPSGKVQKFQLRDWAMSGTVDIFSNLKS